MLGNGSREGGLSPGLPRRNSSSRFYFDRNASAIMQRLPAHRDRRRDRRFMCKIREWKRVLVPVRATRIWPSCGRPPLTPVGSAATFHCRVGVSCALPTDVCAGKRKRGDAQQPLRLQKRSAGRVLLATGGTQPPPHGSRSSRLVLFGYGNACETWQQLPDPLLCSGEC